MTKLFAAIALLITSLSGITQDLIKLIKEGDLAGIQKMEAKGGDIYQELTIDYRHPDEDDNRTTYLYPITYAAAKNQIEIVKFYLTKKDVLIESGDWNHILDQTFICALSTRNDELIELIYAEKPEFKETCESCRNHNAVMVAASYGLEKWFFILKEKSDLMLTNENGCTIVHCAIVGGSIAIVSDLIATGNYDINQQDYEGYSMLDYAALDSNAQIFNYLLEKGADLNATKKLWFSTAESGNMEIFKILTEKYDHNLLFDYNEFMEWPLHFAVAYDDTEMALEILKLMKAHFLAGYNANFDSTPLTDFEEYHLLSWPIYWKNATIYEGIMDFVHTINTNYDDPEYITFQEYFHKKAIKSFGKKFVEEMDTKYPIVWY